MNDPYAETQKDESYVVFKQRTQGWTGSGFNRKFTTLKVRRVRPYNAEPEQIQIEITIDEIKGDKERCYSSYGDLTLTPEQAKVLTTELLREVQS